MFPLHINSNYFEVVTSFKPFNSTGAISFSSNHFNGVSFEWALTHRSFSRILPDSSNSFQSYSRIHGKVWRKNGLSSVICLSPRSFKFFHRWFIISSIHCSGVPQKIHGGASHHHSQHFKIKVECLLNLAPFSWRFMFLTCCHPRKLFPITQFFSYTSGAFHELFRFLIVQRPSFQKISSF